jgi:hypothetical protein
METLKENQTCPVATGPVRRAWIRRRERTKTGSLHIEQALGSGERYLSDEAVFIG